MATTGQLFYDPIPRPLSSTGLTLPNGYYNFYVSGTTTPATVYQDAALTLPFSALTVTGTSPGYSAVQADATGAFPVIFLSPSTVYRVQLYSSTLVLLEDTDPYVPAMPVTGNGPLTINAQGEMTIRAPSAGGTGVSLTVSARSSGTPLQLNGSGAGAAALAVNSAVVAGAQVATFTASNKPGAAGGVAVAKWLPITADGATYYLPLWT